ncbi:MAG: hypothetical protein EXS38_04010 [Opitutus sp.]|nr:hypothetical protein [Opitutus sp.]
MNANPASESRAPHAVLLVDDESALLQSLKLGLEREFALDLASSAAEADLMMATRSYGVVVCVISWRVKRDCIFSSGSANGIADGADLDHGLHES